MQVTGAIIIEQDELAQRNAGYNGCFVLLAIGLFFQVVLLVVQIWNHMAPHLLLMDEQDDKNSRTMVVIVSLLFAVPTQKEK